MDLSNFSNQIYFKDFLIIIYFIALKYNLIFKLKYSKLFIVIIILLSLFGFLGYEFSKNDILYYVFGLRSYCFSSTIFNYCSYI